MRVIRLQTGGAVQLRVSGLAILTCLIAGCASPVPPPDYKINPSPQEKYLITVVSNRPIPKDARMRLQFDIQNRKCIPIDYQAAIGGVRLRYTVHRFVDVTFLSPTSLEATVAYDEILPHDYWALGVCTWGITADLIYFNGNPGYGVLISNDVITGEGWEAWGCRPPTGVLHHPLCYLLTESDKWNDDEFAVKPPDSMSEWQLFWINSQSVTDGG